MSISKPKFRVYTVKHPDAFVVQDLTDEAKTLVIERKEGTYGTPIIKSKENMSLDLGGKMRPFYQTER